ncbi:hypothetical protein C1S70_07235 (plasmid) [Azospirillum argentinense]|uniref:PRC-barrel domain-containing protein n=2 Tax=Azospirillum argentinense TaxID=2970906 RepID=A0A2K1G4L7_9PROT|nr:hypothetical protein C1S70_07235 [Azospirillum argentinense]
MLLHGQQQESKRDEKAPFRNGGRPRHGRGRTLARPAERRHRQPGQRLSEVKDDNVMVPSLKRTVGQLDDMDVLGPDGTKIGEVEEVLMDASGQPVAVVVDVEHGVGIGDKEVIVGLDQLRDDGRTLTTALTNAQLGTLPIWDD